MMQYKRLLFLLLSIVILLLVPFIAMQFTHEVNWSWFDFMIAGVLLLVTAWVFEWVMRKVHPLRLRIALCVALLALLLLIWAELAVGIFGSPFSGQ